MTPALPKPIGRRNTGLPVALLLFLAASCFRGEEIEINHDSLADGGSGSIGLSARLNTVRKTVCSKGCDYEKLALKIFFDSTCNLARIGLHADSAVDGKYDVRLVADKDGAPDGTALTAKLNADLSSYADDHHIEIPVPVVQVEAALTYWVTIEQTQPPSSGTTNLRLVRPPLDEFDLAYTTMSWNGSSWQDTGFFGIVWIRTDGGRVFGQTKSGRHVYPVGGKNLIGQIATLPVPNIPYVLKEFNIYLSKVATTEGSLWLTLENDGTGAKLWSGSIGEAAAISAALDPDNIYVYTFPDPKPQFGGVSRVRFHLSSLETASESYEINSLAFFVDSGASAIPGFMLLESSDSGTSWKSDPSEDLQAHFVVEEN